MKEKQQQQQQQRKNVVPSEKSIQNRSTRTMKYLSALKIWKYIILLSILKTRNIFRIET